MRKRFLSIFLVLALCLAYLPVTPVYAAGETMNSFLITGMPDFTLGGQVPNNLAAVLDATAYEAADATFSGPAFPMTLVSVQISRGTPGTPYTDPIFVAGTYYVEMTFSTDNADTEGYIVADSLDLANTVIRGSSDHAAYSAGRGADMDYLNCVYSFTLNPVDLEITAESATKTYDGTPLTAPNYTITGGDLLDGHSIESITINGTQTDAGSSPNVVSWATITTPIAAADYVVVTGCYNITYVDGTLTVEQAPVIIEAISKDIRTGQPAPSLADPQEGIDYTVTGLFGTDTLTSTPAMYYWNGAPTNAEDLPTSPEGMYDIRIDPASGTVGANYYIADRIAGNLVITDYPIAQYSVPPTDLDLVYNGQPQALANAKTEQGTIRYEYGGEVFMNDPPKETNAGNYPLEVALIGTPGEYSDGGETTITTTIQPAPVTVKANNFTINVGDAAPDLSAPVQGTHYTVTGLIAPDVLTGTAVMEYVGGDPDTSVAGTVDIIIAGLDVPSANYDLQPFETGTLTIKTPSGTKKKTESYDFTQPEEGPGSGKITDLLWKWGDRANLPKDLATLYMVLSNNSVSENEDNPLPYPGLGTEHFLASDATWVLPEVDPDYGPYDVQTVLVCEDHEPIYTANGDGKVDQSTFGNSDFYTVGVGTGDTKIDYANLKTGDVVSNTTFNGVFVTKLSKSNNPTFDADLAKLKSDTIASFRAFELDHPEVFWLNGSIKLRVLTVTLGGEQTSFIFMTLVDDKGFTMRITEYAAAGSIEAAIKQRDAAVDAIIAQIPAGTSDREKIVNLNKWFTMNNEYNRSTDLTSIGFTPHRSLKSLTGNFGINGPVCDGYSRGFKTVCDRLGIPVVLETGVASIGSHSELHMWMSIRVDGTWYGTDCTWDDPIVKGKDGKISGYENEKYLLVGNDTVVDGAKFGVSHPANKTPGGTTGVLFASLVMSANEIDGYVPLDYEDVRTGDWFYDYVQNVSKLGLMNGTSPNLFSPQGTATRGQIVQILYNIAGQPEIEEAKVDGWFGVPATWAMDKGIVAGYPDGDFHGNDPVTREQLATILWAFEGSPAVTGQIGFADAGTISGWAQQPMLWAKLEGILGGKPGNLADPQGTATRAEIATIFSNYMK